MVITFVFVREQLIDFYMGKLHVESILISRLFNRGIYEIKKF